MSINIVTVSCTFRKFDWYESGKEYRGKRQTWDSVRALVSMPPIDLGNGFVLGGQESWAAVDPPKIRGNKEGKVDRSTLSNAIEAFKHGYIHALVWDGLFNVWGGDKGQPKRELRFGFRSFRLSMEPLAPLNRVILQGRVTDHNPQAPWFTVEDVYANPKADESKGEKRWKIRPVPVWCVRPFQGSLNGREVLVFGKFSATAVVSMTQGQPLQSQPFTHVIAEEVHVCPS